MIELFVFAVVAAIVLAVFGLVAAVLSFVVWLVMLPFQLLGLIAKGLGFLAALPFLLLLGLAGLFVGGIGALFLLGPLLPIVLIVAGVIWLVRRGGRDRRSHATVGH